MKYNPLVATPRRRSKLCLWILIVSGNSLRGLPKNHSQRRWRFAAEWWREWEKEEVQAPMPRNSVHLLSDAFDTRFPLLCGRIKNQFILLDNQGWHVCKPRQMKAPHAKQPGVYATIVPEGVGEQSIFIEIIVGEIKKYSPFHHLCF